MKKIIFSLVSLLLLLAVMVSCGDGERVDQIDSSIPAPQPVEVTSVKPIAGGAVIRVKIPDDENLKGVVATFNRNGTVVNQRISRYIDTLLVEGYADSLEHEVEVCAFNTNEVKSTPVMVKFTPLAPAIQTVKLSMLETFGGVKVHMTNNVNLADMSLILYADQDTTDINKPDDQRKWVEVTTMFSAAEEIFLTRRGMKAQKTLFKVVPRDHWGNMGAAVDTVLTPMAEEILDKRKFSYPADLSALDNCRATSNTYRIPNLWDLNYQPSDINYGHLTEIASGSPRPSWITIDMGQTAQLSRVHVTPRGRYLPWQSANTRSLEFWGWIGEGKPTKTAEDVTEGNKHGFEDGWVQLGFFEYKKPTGYQPDGSVGTFTEEDVLYYINDAECEFDNTIYPHAFDPIRYLRVVFVDTFATYGTDVQSTAYQLGELTPWGSIIK